MNFDYNYYPQLTEFMNEFNLREFEIRGVNKFHQRDYNEITKEILESKFINYNFKRYQMIIFVGFLLIFATIKRTTT